MTENDAAYVRHLIACHVLKDAVLELGAGYGGLTCRELVHSAGLRYRTVDLQAGPGVDFVTDMEHEANLNVFDQAKPFGSILILNVLEHTFEPLAVLDNCLRLLAPGGNLVVLTPCVWPLHFYPQDTLRLNPDFYTEYARRRNLELPPEHFHFVGYGPVRDFHDATGGGRYPPPTLNRCGRIWSKIVHELAHTCGRKQHFPNRLAVAAVLMKK
jgi:SAM-dependent methyltransferase